MFIKLSLLLIFSFSALTVSTQPLPDTERKNSTEAALKTWRRYTMPGPRHKASPDFPPYQGSDRTEWMHYFKVSPVDPTFMMVGLDMTGAFYSTNGREFKSVDMHLHRWANNVTFSPHDGHTAYMHYGHSCDSLSACYPPDSPIPGIWRTTDKGASWEQIYTMPSDAPQCRGPAGKQQIAIDPHPGHSGHIYFGSLHRGLMRSVDHGRSWESIAFGGYPVKTIEAAKGADGQTILYVIVGEKGHTVSRNYVPAGRLWRIEVAGEAPYEISPFQLNEKPELVDIEVNPSDWTRGLAIRKIADGTRGGRELLVFSNKGTQFKVTQTIDEAGVRGFVDVHINPTHTDHAIVRSHTQTMSNAVQYSLDGGVSWNEPYPIVDGHIPNIISYNPTHYNAPGGAMRNTFQAAQGPAIGFDPRDPSVVYWWTHNYIDKTPVKSTDYGATWKPFAYGGPFKQAIQIAVGPKHKHMGVGRAEHGLITSRDSGLSWIASTHLTDPVIKKHLDEVGNTTQGKFGRGIAYKPDDPDVLVGLYGSPTIILTSHDGGLSWEDTGVEAGGRSAVYWSPANPSVVYAGKRRSVDAGDTWEPMDRLVLAVSASNENILVGNQSTGGAQLALSVDGGKSWKALPAVPEENYPGTSIAKPPISPTMICGIQTAHAVSIDPSLKHDPTVEGNEGVRILAAGRRAVYEYTSQPDDPFEGTWDILNEGFEPSVHFSRIEPVPWIGHVAFDPRPGMEHVVYACKSSDPRMCRSWRTIENPNMVHFNGQARRPLYRSRDGGQSWEALHAPEYAGMPDHLDVTALEVGPDGSLYVGGYSGIYALPGLPEE